MRRKQFVRLAFQNGVSVPVQYATWFRINFMTAVPAFNLLDQTVASWPEFATAVGSDSHHLT
jgi:hypothetical protein